jgi:hypothetical protein
MALLYFTVRFRETQGTLSLAGAGLAACAATLVRYEGWFLIPFAVAYVLLAARGRRLRAAVIFGIIASIGPIFWLAHNWWLTGDMMASFTGPYSAKAQMAGTGHPGNGSLRMAWIYYRTGIRLCVSPWLAWLGLAGAVACLWKRAWWPVALLAMPAAFYVWAIYRSNTFIYVPPLWPYSYDATRYAMAGLPLVALASAGLVAAAPRSLQTRVAGLVIAAGLGWWVVHPHLEDWVVYQEGRVNSVSRRAFTDEAAQYLEPLYVRGSGIVVQFGDLTGIFREAGIPLRETFIQDFGVPWVAILRRPDLFLWQEWAVAIEGDEVHNAMQTAAQYGVRYKLEKTIPVDGAPAVEIFRRTGGSHGPS